MMLASVFRRGPPTWPGPSATSAHRNRFKADFLGATLHDLADRRCRERRPEVAVPIDAPKDAPLDDLGALEPALQGTERAGCLIEPERNGHFDAGAFLIAFRASQSHDHPVGLEAQIRELERGELRAAEGAGEPDQEQRSVACSGKCFILDRGLSLQRNHDGAEYGRFA